MGEDARSWSHAPGDILALILSKLAGGDVAMFLAVCKTWRSVHRLEKNLSDEELCTSPCLIFPNNRFFHPMYNVWFEKDFISALPEGVIHAQKYGWLLMERMYDYPFFFNPFTNQRIDTQTYTSHNFTNFSTLPTSVDCEIFTFYMHGIQMKVETIKLSDIDEGPLLNVCKDKNFSFLSQYKSIFFQGEYYCLGKDGRFAIFNPNNRKKNRATAPPRKLWDHFNAPDCGRYLIAGDEDDLWAVFIALQGREVCVCKLNLSNMIFERVHDIGDRMLFISRESCLMQRAKVRGARNKIYLPKLMGEHCLFYSLTTKKYHTFDMKGPSYESFHGSQDLMGCTWIEMNINPSQFAGKGYNGGQIK